MGNSTLFFLFLPLIMQVVLLLLLLHNYAINITWCAANTNITTDQLALLELKARITRDPQNMLQTNWSVHDQVSSSVCNWVGVTCGSKHGRVTALNLTLMDLTATLPPHLGNLSFLASFNIRANNFHGTLPVEISNLRRLKYINLGNNSFDGDIPSWFGSLPRLRRLFLYGNRFTGVIPPSFGNLSKLENLNLYNNDLRGEIPITLGNLSNLLFLYLQGNQLSGKIRSIERLTSLEAINLSGNNFTAGRIPTLPPSLVWFILQRNNLFGEIPVSVCNLSSLVYIDVSMNNLGGTIPHCLGNLSSPLLYMNLYKNNFHGTIPAEIFPRNCLLSGFGINHNQFEGSIPRSLANCKDLEILDVGHNILNDTFPSWLGHLDHLQVLNLRSNRFHGQIVDSQLLTSNSSFSRLRIIDLSSNHFSGALPSKFFESLSAIGSSGNQTKGGAEYMSYNYSGTSYLFTPQLPVSTKGSEIELTYILTSLTLIDFSSNQFFGHIPETLGQLQSLRVLNISYNSLTGHIPSSLANLTMLESFDLSSNKLQGRIPMEFTNLGFLEVFNLSNNNLSGPIPQGKQFLTFGNDSYIGNLGLCGPPLPKRCGNAGEDLKPTPPRDQIIVDDDDERSELNWKFFMMMGYGCGLVFGLSTGYIMFATGKPRLIVRIVKRVQKKYVVRKIR